MEAMVRIAHISDLHLLSPLGAEWRRATGELRGCELPIAREAA
jgi:hypothetical protein